MPLLCKSLRFNNGVQVRSRMRPSGHILRYEGPARTAPLNGIDAGSMGRKIHATIAVAIAPAIASDPKRQLRDPWRLLGEDGIGTRS